MDRMFEKDHPRTYYIRPEIDLEDLWKTQNTTQKNKGNDINPIGKSTKLKNLVEPEDNPMVDEFIMTFKQD